MGTHTLSYVDASGPHSIDLIGDSTSIGRSPNQDVVLSDPCVSRHHALIVRKNDIYTIVDQNSTHGTFLNATRIERATLKSGDVLQMGSLQGPQLRFRLRQNNQTTANLLQSPANDLLSSLSELRLPADELRPAALEMEKLNWLLRAARQLNEGRAIEDILSAFLHLTLQLTGLERGFVFLQEEGEMRLAQGLSADGETLQEDSTVSRRAIHKAIESESEFSISDTLTDDDTSGWSSIMANSIRSICCIPLRKRASAKEPSRLLGLLYLDSQIGLEDLTKLDHELLDTIAAEAAALQHNALLADAEYKARRAREELAVAAKIHSGLMAGIPSPASSSLITFVQTSECFSPEDRRPSSTRKGCSLSKECLRRTSRCCQSAVVAHVLRPMMSYPRTITPTVWVDHSIFDYQIVTELLHQGRSAVLKHVRPEC